MKDVFLFVMDDVNGFERIQAEEKNKMCNSKFRNFLFWFCFVAITHHLLPITCLYATPSTHIWTPSTDIQPYKKFHLTADFYTQVKKNDNGSWAAPVTNFGLTLGVLPYEKIQAEVGFDHIAGYGSADSYPFYFNAKIGTPEDSLKKGLPTLVLGTYALGTKKDLTNYNILYFKLAKTLAKVGKFSLGYY